MCKRDPLTERFSECDGHSRCYCDDRPRRRVLVVDDNEQVRRATVRVLRSAGLDVTSAPGPVEAALCYQMVDVVVTDWSMPDGGGERVLKEAGRPVVVYSGSLDAVDELASRGVMAVSKPAWPDDLIAAIDAAVELQMVAA